MISNLQKPQKNAFSLFMVFHTPATPFWLFARPRLKTHQPCLKTSEGGLTILRCGFLASNAHRGISAHFRFLKSSFQAFFGSFFCYRKSDPFNDRYFKFQFRIPWMGVPKHET